MNKIVKLLQNTHKRRRVLIHQKTSLADIENSYPALFSRQGIVNEYDMVTGSVTTMRMSRLNCLEKGPKLVQLAESMLPDDLKKLTGKQTAIKLILNKLNADSCSDVDDVFRIT